MAEVLRFPAGEARSERRQPPPDDAAVRAAALDTRASFIVEAPAGSGKTGLLVQRFLKLLAEDGPEIPGPQQPEEVLAMTFTRKATAEMSQRVLGELQAAADDAPLRPASSAFERETRALAEAVLRRSEQLGWNLLEQPQRLNIRSILSVCMEIANSLPLLSGSRGAQRPVEFPAPLYRTAARRTLLQLGGKDAALHEALRTLLLHRDGSLSNCESLLARMLHDRDQWAELVPLDRASLDDDALETVVRPRLERSLEKIVCAGLARAATALPPETLCELTALAQGLSTEPGYKGAESPLAFCAGRHQPPEARAEHLAHWIALIDLLLVAGGTWRKGFNANHLGFTLPKDEKAQLEALIASLIAAGSTEEIRAALCAVRCLPPARYPDEQWQVARALFHVLRHALAELKVLFAERGQCDFAELALAAREALRSDEGAANLAGSAGVALRHLLVDEMQDTSSSQYDLLSLLTRSWDGHSQTLFLVGDPKQSIYLFRQARVERFLRTMEDCRLGDVPLTPLRLTSNFRSQALLVEGFNDTFGGDHPSGRIFPAPGDASLSGFDAADVPFVEAVAIREKTAAAGVVWHAAVLGEETYDPSIRLTQVAAIDHAAQEALEVRRLIERRLATPLPAGRNDARAPRPWRIAVLARARAHLSAIVKELKAHDGKPEIPFRAIDLDPLGELPEVQDALALTRALLHPADRGAWLAVLHGPACGLGLADLLALTGEGPDSDPDATVAQLVAGRRRRLSAEGQLLLDRAWPVLEEAAATLGRTPLSVHVERTWRSLGLDAPLDRDRRSNVLRFFELLRDIESEGGPIELNVLSERLQALYAAPRSGNIQVDLLTIHKAKGLEWDVVLVPGLHRRPRSTGSAFLNWLEFDEPSLEQEASIVLAPIWGKGSDSDKLNGWLKDVRSKRERCEEKRLFYVAATRAREELHLFAAAARRSSGEIALPAGGALLKACWPAAEKHFAALPPAPASAALSDRLLQSFYEEDEAAEASQGLALAAAAAPAGRAPVTEPAPPILHRLPLAFDPLRRFTGAAARALAYTPASALRHAPAFERPEGSFPVRAFGNVVHRFLQVLAAALAADTTADSLLAELPSWQPRLLASLRAEGLPPALCRREAGRALQALSGALADPAGRWLLSPRAAAASERALTFASPTTASLRVDRTFLAGDAPLTEGDGFIWIVDFKTTQQGPRSLQLFDEQERAKYAAQLESYAAVRRSLPDGGLPIVLALYYPLLPRLISWRASAN